MSLPRALRDALDDALPDAHTLTRPLAAALAEALTTYHATKNQPRVSRVDQARQRRAMRQADLAVTGLLTKLDALDRAYRRRPGTGKGRVLFVWAAHDALRREARVCQERWHACVALRPAPGRGTPRDEARRQLGHAVIWAFHDAGVPLTVHRRPGRGGVVDVLRVLLRAADPALVSPRADLYRTARVWVRDVQTLHADVTRAGGWHALQASVMRDAV